MNFLVLQLLAVLFFMITAFLVSVFLKRNDVVDVAWGLGFAMLAWVSYSFGTHHVKCLFMACLVTLWGLRLAFYTGLRMWGKPEDYRYAAWRKSWTSFFYLQSFVKIYLIQGFFMLIVMLPVVWAQHEVVSWGFFWPLGLALWSLGFFFEAVGDAQLRAFVRNPAHAGKICTVGLWRYTRHPNYFGEVTLWWGMFLITLPHDFWYVTIAGPLCITWLLLYVSGIPLLEKQFAGNKDFEVYKKETSPFFPWFVKKAE